MMTLVPTLLLLTAATGARGQVSAATNLVAATPPVRLTSGSTQATTAY